MRLPLLLLLALTLMPSTLHAKPVRVAIVRLTHAHVSWLLSRPRDIGDVEIVGIYEPNVDLAQRRMAESHLDPSICFTDLDEMLRQTKPEAVCHFGSIREHRDDTIRCIEAGAHVMVEKPLALNLKDAQAMAAAARKAKVHLLTNFETTWYASNQELQSRLAEGKFGAIRRMVFRTGHRGPIEIGCGPEFLEWLLDPAENGGGAIVDFGCYGANLSTWLMQGRRPTSVMAVTQQIKPDLYPHVDDDATITLTYSNSQGGEAVTVIQPSWNWPHSVKDLAVACERGDLRTVGGDALRAQVRGEQPTESNHLPALEGANKDPFAHLAAVVHGEVEPNALSSLKNNLVVMEILDAARESAATGRRIDLPEIEAP